MTENTNIQNDIKAMGKRAKDAARALANASTGKKNQALALAEAYLRDHTQEILTANKKDLAAVKDKNLSDAMLDRLQLDKSRIHAIADGLASIQTLDDPVGQVIANWTRPNGLDISRVRTPLGVIGVVFESRPNVTADAGALCLKAGNAVILRGGSESFHSNTAIFGALKSGIISAGLPEDAIQLVHTRDRAAVGAMLQMNEYIDIIVPRGGRSLVERVQNESRVPVFAHLEGICHVYIDGAADPEKARDIIVNAKMRRTGICGAAETLLIDKAAYSFITPSIEALIDAGCEIKGDAETAALNSNIDNADETDWTTEYLAPILSARMVDGVDGAIAHIAKYSSNHTETIVTENSAAAERFLNEVDSAIVMHNASTQFADGGEFGMGAEIGIATGRIHARGPVGLEQLTSFKYQVRGTGQTRP